MIHDTATDAIKEHRADGAATCSTAAETLFTDSATFAAACVKATQVACTQAADKIKCLALQADSFGLFVKERGRVLAADRPREGLGRGEPEELPDVSVPTLYVCTKMPYGDPDVVRVRYGLSCAEV